jgi:RND family efflux transporter MFP subunit
LSINRIILIRLTLQSLPLIRLTFLALVFIGIFSGCSESNSTMSHASPHAEPMSVNVVSVSRQSTFTAQREFAGRVEAPRRSRLGFEFVGKLQNMGVEQGSQVLAGQALASLDTGLLNLELQRVKAQADEVTVLMEQTEIDFRRQQRLKRQGLSFGQQIDNLNAQYKAYKAKNRAVEAEIAGLKLRIDKSVLYAPFNGEVSEVYLDEGETVGEAQPALLLVEAGEREATFGIPQDQGEQIKRGQKLPILGAFGISEGVVRVVRHSVSADTLSRTITLALPHSLALSDGVIIYLILPEERAVPGFWLPQDALIGDVRGTWSIYALEPEIGEPHLVKHSVQHIYQRQSNVYVQSVLAEGTQVVMNGMHRVANGLAVAPKLSKWQAPDGNGNGY